jgi:hypothetical protein
MGVAVADKTPALGRLEDGGLKDPEVLGGAAQRQNGLGGNAGAVVSLGNPEQVRVAEVLMLVSPRNVVFCATEFWHLCSPHTL